MMNQAVESEYQSSLDYEAKKVYKEKLRLECEQIYIPDQTKSGPMMLRSGQQYCMDTSTTI